LYSGSRAAKAGASVGGGEKEKKRRGEGGDPGISGSSPKKKGGCWIYPLSTKKGVKISINLFAGKRRRHVSSKGEKEREGGGFFLRGTEGSYNARKKEKRTLFHTHKKREEGLSSS